jgi:nicotinamide-nucleotide amidase
MRIYLLNIGDEILIGQIVNTNAAWMGRQLNLIGARVVQAAVVGDDLAQIQQGLRAGLEQADAVLITGGLGPTKDDVTKKALADFFGVELSFHEPTFDRLTRIFARFGRSTTEAHKEQCFIPDNAVVLTNQQGTAPGLWMEHQGKALVSMPGVPHEMEYLMTEEVMPRLREKFGGKPIQHRTLLTVGEGETILAERIADIEDALPDHIKLAYLPNLGQVRLRLTGSAPDEAALAAELDHYQGLLAERLPDVIFGYDNDTLEAAVGRLLRERGLTLATAESCTGGYLAHLVTSVPGSSAYFQGSVVAYDNRIKQLLLGVSPDTLAAHGAVSEATVREMVAGARRQLGVDVAVATSGIAGPDGGTPDKPVGTIWLAVGNGDRTETRLIRAGKDRVKNIHLASIYALDMVRKLLG